MPTSSYTNISVYNRVMRRLPQFHLWQDGGRHSRYMNEIHATHDYLDATGVFTERELINLFKLTVNIDNVYLTNIDRTVVLYETWSNKNVLYFKHRGQCNAFRTIIRYYSDKLPGDTFGYTAKLVLKFYNQ